MIRIYKKSGIVKGYSWAEYQQLKKAKWKIGKN